MRTTDGFELAEVDLEIRGEGTIMGERQKGRSDLKLASLTIPPPPPPSTLLGPPHEHIVSM